jgi:hypothetical protein
LSLRLAQNLSKQRAKAFTKETKDHFFEVLRTKLVELDILNRPECILNCDESGYAGSFGQKKLFARKGDKNPHALAPNNEKLVYTVLVSFFLETNFSP